jgi:hypothetical protein
MSRIIRKLIIGTEHDQYGVIPNPHKTMGYGALLHFAYRYTLFLHFGSMGFNGYMLNVCMILLHLVLSMSSFLFPIRETRIFANQIIWRELQLHNIVFTVRSCAIFVYCMYSDSPNTMVRFVLVMTSHLLADLVSSVYGKGHTMRDMAWDGALIPVSAKPAFDHFYAISQFGATCALLMAPTPYLLDYSFIILLPIQLSTFLMTLRLKGFIGNDMWHFVYSGSLLVVYHVGYYCVDARELAMYQLAFYIWRVVLRQNKYSGWFFLVLAREMSKIRFDV